MILLDTNILIEITADAPDRGVVRWLDSVDRSDLWTTAICIFEMEFGVHKRDEGRRREEARAKLDDLVTDMLSERIVAFDHLSAAIAARLFHARRRIGRTVPERDTFIAGIALLHQATFVTRNVTHFADLAIDVVNPWGPNDPGPDA